MMTRKDIDNLIELAESKIRAGVNKEEALKRLMHVGILDANGNNTPLFQQLIDEAAAADKLKK